MNTIPYYDENLGDGISLWLSEADVVDNFIYNSARAGMSLFGATAWVTDNYVMCQLFDLAGNPYLGVDYAYHNGGGNWCGCDADSRSAALTPPRWNRRSRWEASNRLYDEHRWYLVHSD